MIPKLAIAIMTGTIANPSNPSVKFTAFEAPIITKAANGIKNQPKSNKRFLKNGIAKLVANGSCPILEIHQATAQPIIT